MFIYKYLYSFSYYDQYVIMISKMWMYGAKKQFIHKNKNMRVKFVLKHVPAH